MAADGNQSGPKAAGSRPSSLIHWLSDRVNFRLFIHTLAAKRTVSRVVAKDEKHAATIKASEYLEICREKALDAYTVEEAIYWHNEIITELSIELHTVQTMRWPETVKASMTIALEDRLSQHAAAVTRLAGILERNEKLIWQP
ncbi:hypothetical protein [Hyphomicrobium sp.]|uniref:hypothetical protein n=1 Tax=Hyphomicrobium sp. TaxID=82 RepID=UPI002D783260|nr:hypothetical protein [Hyphomicrobium sp.]HET6390695.1 hypothetical protein [Hyphomicrobium sp.]